MCLVFRSIKVQRTNLDFFLFVLSAFEVYGGLIQRNVSTFCRREHLLR